MDNRQGYRPDAPVRRLLDTINNPQELKKLPPELLPQLAQEIREKIISTVAKTGGHLAPSLGVVDLSIALHYVFDCPRDKIVWDVGHQAYAHKLLTGRQDRFHTLRQHGGLSGFPKRGESCYDAFDTGHSSTSISAALGMTVGKSLGKNVHAGCPFIPLHHKQPRIVIGLADTQSKFAKFLYQHKIKFVGKLRHILPRRTPDNLAKRVPVYHGVLTFQCFA